MRPAGGETSELHVQVACERRQDTAVPLSFVATSSEIVIQSYDTGSGALLCCDARASFSKAEPF